MGSERRGAVLLAARSNASLPVPGRAVGEANRYVLGEIDFLFDFRPNIGP